MSVFNNLLHLYKKSGASNTPTEDYCTECLAGILKSDPLLTMEFAHRILNIESETPFKVSTQRTFYSKMHNKQCRIDLVFESQSTLCFVEMKVHSFEGDEQLENYAQILDEQPKTISTSLRYCTLYNDEKDFDDDFEQFRWQDIAIFLKPRIRKNRLIKEFYNFLEEKNMAGNERFNHEDLVGLKVYNDIAVKVDDVFERTRPSLKRFGTVGGGLDAGKQIVKHNRWALYSKDIIGNKNGGKSEVLISFDFKGMRYKEEPVMAAQIYVNINNSSYKPFIEAATKYYQDKTENGKKVFTRSDQGHGAHIRYEKPLAMFFSEEEQLRSIQEWVESKLGEMMEFRNDHPKLAWNFNHNDAVKISQ